MSGPSIGDDSKETRIASENQTARASEAESRSPEESATSRTTHFNLVCSYSIITDEVRSHKFYGSGSVEDPFVVDYLPNDPLNPQLWPSWIKWTITAILGFATLAVASGASSYASAYPQLREDFGSSDEVLALGLSVYLIGFAFGPLLWSPLSEEYGRQPFYFGTFFFITVFMVGATVSSSIASLIVFRCLAGSAGSSILTNSGGVIADMFNSEQRGVATALWSSAAFIGPAIGPIVSGFVAERAGWRWVQGTFTIFIGVLWICGSLFIPETYSPVILRRRAQSLSHLTGKVHRSIYDKQSAGVASLSAKLRRALTRPWVLLIHEPIVVLISVYMAIIYATLFMLLGAFPVVFNETRHWSQGIGGLPFFGVAIGMVTGAAHMVLDNNRYLREIRKPGNDAPEVRLPQALYTLGSMHHWNGDLLSWRRSCFLAGMNYLIDSYAIFAASVLAANTVLRAVLAAAFPLFTKKMYHNLGIHWASSIPAFLTLLCTPAPFIFYKYGKRIRLKCKFAAQAYEYLQIQRRSQLPEKEREKEVGVDEQGITV